MQKRVLLIEDNADDIALARRAFRKAGLDAELLAFEDGATALRHLEQPGDGQPSLILLDLQLPGLSGLDILRRLRAASPTRLLPVVVMTSSDERRDIEGSYAAGANSYLIKPVEFADFVELIRLLNQYWLVRNRVPPAPGRRQ